MMKMKALAVVAAALAVSAPAFAQTKTTLTDVLANSGVTFSGRAEAGYDVANTTNNAAPTFGNYNKGDSFVLHQVGLNIAKTSASGLGGAVTVLAGEDANFISGNEVTLLQGYLSYAAGNLTVIGGRFLTLAGAEVIDAGANFNASRGLLFATQSVYHNGVRATYKVSDTLSLTGGLVNEIYVPENVDSNDNKALELNATAVTGMVTNSLTAYISDEDTAKKTGRTMLVDYVATLPLSPATTLALNADYYNFDNGDNDDAYGVAAYVNHKLDASNRVAVRGEYLHGQDQGPVAHLKAFTLTYGHALSSDFEVTAEARLDYANEGNAVYATEDGDAQYMGSIRGVYKF